MRILVDTHILLWAIYDSARLSSRARELLAGDDVEAYFSAASLWEIAIKAQLRRGDFAIDAEAVAKKAVRIGFAERPITAEVAARTALLPLHHRDPFDRLLVAQAMADPARLITADSRLVQYSELVELV